MCPENAEDHGQRHGWKNGFGGLEEGASLVGGAWRESLNQAFTFAEGRCSYQDLRTELYKVVTCPETVSCDRRPGANSFSVLGAMLPLSHHVV